ncbi:MAG: sensor histidine kinase [Thermoplasmatota archaeon]
MARFPVMVGENGSRHSLGPRPVASDVEAAVDATFLRHLPLVLLIAGGLTVATAPWWAMAIPGPAGQELVLYTVAVGLMACAVAFAVERKLLPLQVVYGAVSLLVCGYLVSDLLYVAISRQPQYNSELWLLAGAGFLVLRPKWLHPIMATGIGGWLVASWGALGDRAVQESALLAFSGVALGYVASHNRAAGVRRIARARVAEAGIRAELEEKAAQTAQARAHLQAITDGSPSGIFHTDAHGMVDYANARWCEIAGGSFTQRARIVEAIHPDERQDVASRWAQSVERGEPFGAEFRVVHDDGAVVHCRARATPMRDAQGRVTGFAGTLEDVTDTRRAAQAVQASEHAMREAQRISHVGSFTWNLPSGPLSWSDEMYRIYGLEPAGAADADTFRHHIHVDDRGKVEAAVAQAIAGSGVYAVDHRLTRADGSIRHVHLQGEVERDAQGRPTRLVGTLNDVTKRVAQARLFRDLLESAPDAMIIAEETGRITLVNQRAELLFGWPRSQLLGTNVRSLVPDGWPEDSAQSAPPGDVGDAPAPGAAIELHAVRRDGSRFPAEMSVSPLQTEEGRLVCAAIRDITQRKAAAEADRLAYERMREIEKLKELDRFRVQVLNVAGHELNTPITPIKMQLYMLKNGNLGKLTPTQAHAVAVLDRNLERLSGLASDVLDVARLQSGHLRMTLKAVDLASAVREVVESFDGPARTAGISLSWSAGKGLSIIADPLRFSQVLYNLVSNAIKFTPAGGKVRLEAVRAGAWVELRVNDTGLGLAKEQIVRLFQPFSQVHDPVTVQTGGSGLGLFISRGIVQQLGGTLEAASQGTRQGSTFVLRLPLATPAMVTAAKQNLQEPSTLGHAIAA